MALNIANFSYPDPSTLGPSVTFASGPKSRTSQRVRNMLTNGASAPIFTLDGALASSVTVAMNAPNAPYRFENAASLVLLAGFYYPTIGAGDAAGSSWRVAFDFDGQKFRFDGYGSGYKLRVWVNEQPSPFFTVPNDVASHTVLVDFGSRAYRRIVIEMDDNSTGTPYFAGIDRLPSDTLWPPGLPQGLGLAILGDSYTFGQAATQRCTGFAQTMARALGTQNSLCLGVPGTGWASTLVAGGAQNYGSAARVADLINNAPDIILAQGSINDSDGHGGTGAIGAAIASWAAKVRSALPAANIILTGVLRPANLTAQDLLVNADIKNAAAVVGLPFIDPQAGIPWFAGTGTTSVPTGDGNADYYYNGTNAGHPSQAGYDALGNRLARELGAIVGLST